MDSSDNIRAALAEANQRHNVQSEQSQNAEQSSADFVDEVVPHTSAADFVDEVVPHTSANKETMYSGK